MECSVSRVRFAQVQMCRDSTGVGRPLSIRRSRMLMALRINVLAKVLHTHSLVGDPKPMYAAPMSRDFLVSRPRLSGAILTHSI